MVNVALAVLLCFGRADASVQLARCELKIFVKASLLLDPQSFYDGTSLVAHTLRAANCVSACLEHFFRRFAPGVAYWQRMTENACIS